MHYVSQYNYFKSLDRLAQASDSKPDLNEAIAGLSRFALREVLNNDEIVAMYLHRTTLGVIKQWANSGVKVDANVIREDLHRKERYFVPQYVMKVNTPRYHATLECKYLRASFENFETPPEIAKLGPDSIREFQTFCDKEWPSYKDRPVDTFWAHVGSRFRVPINPKEISYASQERPESVRDQTESELLEKIHESVENVRNHARSSGLNGYIYAQPKRLYSLTRDERIDAARRQAFLELLKLKKAIKMLVFNFHRIELEMPEGLLSDELLEAFGFLPCRACCGLH